MSPETPETQIQHTPPFKTTFKLRYKITLWLTMLVVVIMAAVSWHYIEQQTEIMSIGMDRQVEKIAKITGAMGLIKTGSGEEDVNWGLVKEYISQVSQLEENILYIIIFNKDGIAQLRTFGGEVFIRAQAEIALSESWQQLEDLIESDAHDKVYNNVGTESTKILSRLGDVHHLTVILEPGGVEMGRLAVGFSRNKLRDEINAAVRFGVILTLAFILAGMIVSVVLATGITKPIDSLSLSMEKVRAGDFSQEVPIKTHDELGHLAFSFNFMTRGLREREVIKSRFKTYVADEVVDKILAVDDINSLSERREVTVFFSDIRSFTSMSEKLEPQEVIEMLNEYFELMIGVIQKYKGTLDKLVGDEIMALWGAPTSHDHDPLRAVLTGLEMQEVLNKLNVKRESEGKDPIYMGVGINTGEVIAGNLGSTTQLQYTVIGDNVNLASRIEGKTSKQEVFISQSTFDSVQQYIEFQKLEPIKVKGKVKPVQIYKVLSLREHVSLPEFS